MSSGKPLKQWPNGIKSLARSLLRIFSGMDVLVAGKHFDALQVGVPVLWEIKTDQYDTFSLFLQKKVLNDQVEEFLEERSIARACGYGFVVGVSTRAHKEALIDLEPSLAPDIVVSRWK